MNSPDFDFILLKAIRYRFFLDHDGRYPTVLLLHPKDFDRLLYLAGESPDISHTFYVEDGLYHFSAVRIIRSEDMPFGTFEYHLNLKAE